jgi:PIN domain nuclease of toxin-antitoxin system
LLLDTHALIWALSAPDKLPKKVSHRLSNPSTLVYASAACTWEIAIKSALGKLDADLDEIIEGVQETGFARLSISMDHTRRLCELPAHHRDPFDRIIVAQAMEEGLTVVTHDPMIGRYPVSVLWN